MKGGAAGAFSLLAAAAIAVLTLSPERRASVPLPPGPRVVPIAAPATPAAPRPAARARSADDVRYEAISFHAGRPDQADADRSSDPAPEAEAPPRPQPSPHPLAVGPDDEAGTD